MGFGCIAKVVLRFKLVRRNNRVLTESLGFAVCSLNWCLGCFDCNGGLMTQVRNLVVAIANGVISLIILLLTNHSRSSLIATSILISLSTYGTSTFAERVFAPRRDEHSRGAFGANRVDEVSRRDRDDLDR